MKRKTEILKLRELEWNFSSCPEDQLFHCLIYEFARESKTVSNLLKEPLPFWNDPKLVLSIGKTEPLYAGTRLLLSDLINDFGELIVKHGAQKSWLEIPEKDRASLKQAFETIRWMTGSEDAISLSSDVDFATTDTLSAKADGIEYGIFRINWNFTDKAMVADFRKFLETYRTRSASLAALNKSIKHKGKRFYLRLLDRLSITRLFHHYSYADANRLFPKLLDYPGLKGSIGTWYDKRKDLKGILNKLFAFVPEDEQLSCFATLRDIKTNQKVVSSQ